MPAPLQTGTLLVASPDLCEDPNFNRTVVFIIHYSAEEGTMGLVINQPLGEQIQLYSAEELQLLLGEIPLEEGVDPAQPAGKATQTQLGRMFYQGGPVDQGHLFFMHRLSDIIEGGTKILDGLYLGGDLDAVRAEAEVIKADQPLLRFYLGYSGWDKGQLEWEISNGAWILAPGDPDLVFTTKPDAIWHEVLYSLGGKYRPISVLPEDPAVN